MKCGTSIPRFITRPRESNQIHANKPNLHVHTDREHASVQHHRNQALVSHFDRKIETAVDDVVSLLMYSFEPGQKHGSSVWQHC
jgi:hypothetical protein